MSDYLDDLDAVERAVEAQIICPDKVLELVSMRDVGLCLECGAEQDGVEPDARRYQCEECGEMMVFGAEEILMSLSNL